MLEMSLFHEAAKTRVDVTGELDIANVGDFDQFFCKTIAVEDCGFLEINLCGLSFIDSTGVRSLMSVIKGTIQKNCEIRIININPMVYEVLETTGLIQLFGFDIFCLAE